MLVSGKLLLLVGGTWLFWSYTDSILPSVPTRFLWRLDL